jgi:hypothetical protein
MGEAMGKDGNHQFNQRNKMTWPDAFIIVGNSLAMVMLIYILTKRNK